MRRAAGRSFAPHVFLLCFLVASLLSVPVAEAVQTIYRDWLPVDSTTWEAAPQLEAAADAVILFDGWLIDQTRYEKFYISRYQRIHLLNEAGVEQYGQVEIEYEEDTKVTKLWARTVKPSGETIKVKGDEIHTKEVATFGRYKLRSKNFAFKNVAPGDIVEYRYVIRDEEFKEPPAKQLRRGHHVVQAEYTWLFLLPDGLSKIDSDFFLPHYSVLNPTKHTLDIARVHNPPGIKLSTAHIPALPDERFRGTDQEQGITFMGHYDFPNKDREYWSWAAEEIGKDSHKFINKASDLAAMLEPLRSQPRELIADLDACAEQLFEHVNTDAALDAIGNKSIPPRKHVNHLLEKGTANRYDLARTLVAMLQQLGYDATVFHARSLDEGLFLRQWESVRQLDSTGVVARSTEAGLVWASIDDCGISRRLPWQLHGATALFEDLGDGDSLPAFPALAPIALGEALENHITLSMDLDLQASGQLAGELEAIWRCDSATRRWCELVSMTEEAALDALADDARPALAGWEKSDETVEFADSTITYRCQVSARGRQEQAGNLRLLDLASLHVDDFELAAGERQSPIYLNYPAVYESTVTVSLPAGAAVEAARSAVQFAQPFAEFSFTESVDDRHIRTERRLVLKDVYFDSGRAAAFIDFARAAYAADDEPLVLVHE